MRPAAAQVHLSQSAMSPALADLERLLSVQLVPRQDARGVTRTAAGARLLGEARQLLRRADELQSLASQLRGEVTGRLALGSFAILAPYVLPDLLTAVALELPDLVLDTTEESVDHLVTGLQDGRLELALGYDLGLDPSITTEVLFTVAPHVVLPLGHRLARRRRVKLTALADEPMILLDLPHSRDYFARLFDAAGVTPVVANARTAPNWRGPWSRAAGRTPSSTFARRARSRWKACRTSSCLSTFRCPRRTRTCGWC